MLPIETEKAEVDKEGNKQIFAGIMKAFGTTKPSLAKQPGFDDIVG